MKKLVLFLSLVFATVAMMAQSFTVSERNPYFKYTGTAADTAISGTGVNISWNVNYTNRYLYHIVADIDEISGSATASCVVQGSMDNANWVAIDTLTATADAALNFDLQSWDKDKGYDWRYMRVATTLSTTGKWDINYIYVKVTPWKP